MALLEQRKRHFLFEANVGAGLPVVSTLRDLIASGDEIVRIEGILSGTLSYLFNTFDGSVPFSALVRDAHAMGFTEPDPREDLSGQDVARKLLILARQIGLTMDLDEVKVESLVPAAARARRVLHRVSLGVCALRRRRLPSASRAPPRAAPCCATSACSNTAQASAGFKRISEEPSGGVRQGQRQHDRVHDQALLHARRWSSRAPARAPTSQRWACFPTSSSCCTTCRSSTYPLARMRCRAGLVPSRTSIADFPGRESLKRFRTFPHRIDGPRDRGYSQNCSRMQSASRSAAAPCGNSLTIRLNEDC